MARLFYAFFLCFLLLAPQTAQSREVVEGPLTGDVLEVLDGDTVVVRLHIWIGETVETHVRLSDIDAPEIHGKCDSERARAAAAKAELAALLADGKIRLSGIRLAKYAGRVLAVAETSGGVAIAQHMLDKGLARPYHGEKRRGWCE